MRRFLSFWPLTCAIGINVVVLVGATFLALRTRAAPTESPTVIPIRPRELKILDLERPTDVFERKGIVVGDRRMSDEPAIFFPQASDHNESGDAAEFLGALKGEAGPLLEKKRAAGVYDAMGVGGGGGGGAVRQGGAFGGRRNLVARGGVGEQRPPARAGSGGGEQESTTEEYDPIREAAFLHVMDAPLSTFSIDVDTASYANVRRFLNEGKLPPKDAVRIEEMLNYFRYDTAGPADEKPFSVHAEVHPAPWEPSRWLVRIGLRGKDVKLTDAPPANLVFLVDVSGSMNPEDRLPLVQKTLRILVERLRAQDRVAMVVYAGSSGCVLDSTPGDRRAEILDAVDRLRAGGSTNGGAGITLAYDIAAKNFIKGGANRVILCTDGDFNVGVTNNGDLVGLIEEKRKTGVFLSVLGYGRGNYADATMEKLADHGNGNAAYIDSIEEAQKVMGAEASGTLLTIAKDVKIQVEFNPAVVAGYRLIGYENRALAAKDFNDDAKDAGEIGAGHQVTALYEVIPAGREVPTAKVDELRYQEARKASGAKTDEMLTVKLRWKQPDGDVSEKIERTLAAPADRTPGSTDFDFASAVAMFGMLLRESEHRGEATWGLVIELARGAAAADATGKRAEFVKLAERARELSGK